MRGDFIGRQFGKAARLLSLLVLRVRSKITSDFGGSAASLSASVSTSIMRASFSMNSPVGNGSLL
jgi:hypothetical protein